MLDVERNSGSESYDPPGDWRAFDSGGALVTVRVLRRMLRTPPKKEGGKGVSKDGPRRRLPVSQEDQEDRSNPKD